MGISLITSRSACVRDRYILVKGKASRLFIDECDNMRWDVLQGYGLVAVF